MNLWDELMLLLSVFIFLIVIGFSGLKNVFVALFRCRAPVDARGNFPGYDSSTIKALGLCVSSEELYLFPAGGTVLDGDRNVASWTVLHRTCSLIYLMDDF